MKITRLSVIGVIYQLKEHLHNNGLATDTTLTGFPFIAVKTRDQAYADLSCPSIVVYTPGISDTELQIGGGYWDNVLLTFDIYADSDGKMLELVDYVMEFIQSPISLLRYDLAQPSYQVLDGNVRTLYSGEAPPLVCQALFDNRRTNVFGRTGLVGESTAHTAQVTAVLRIPTA